MAIISNLINKNYPLDFKIIQMLIYSHNYLQTL